MFTDTLPLTISASAAHELLQIYHHKLPDQSMGLRIGVQTSGCSGTSYVLGFDHQQESDTTYQWQGLSVFIAKKHILYLVGITIDFVDDVQNRGFIFNFENT